MKLSGKQAFIVKRLEHASPATIDKIFQILDNEVPDPKEEYLTLEDLRAFYTTHTRTQQVPLLTAWRALTKLAGVDVRDSTNHMHRAGFLPNRSILVSNLVIGRESMQSIPKSTLEKIGVAEWVASFV